MVLEESRSNVLPSASVLQSTNTKCKRKHRSDFRKLRGSRYLPKVDQQLTSGRPGCERRNRIFKSSPFKMQVNKDLSIRLSPDVPLLIPDFPDFTSWLNSGSTPNGLTEVHIPGYYVIDANVVWFQNLVNPNGLLSDEHIGALLNLLITMSRRAPAAFFDGWTLVESQGWAALSSDAIANRHELIVPYVDGPFPIQGGLSWTHAVKIYGVAHIGPSINGHWVLFEAIISERKIIFYDSLSRTASWDRVATVFTNVAFNPTTLLTRVEYCYPIKLFWDVIRFEHPPQQSNTFDCGIMAIKFLECLVTGWSLDVLEVKNATGWRYLYGAALYRMGLEYANQMEVHMSATYRI